MGAEAMKQSQTQELNALIDNLWNAGLQSDENKEEFVREAKKAIRAWFRKMIKTHAPWDEELREVKL
jgi:hypothetical protein